VAEGLVNISYVFLRSWTLLVAHACNPSHSGGRDQENHGLKPAQANSLQDPILEKTLHQKDPELKPQLPQKKGKKILREGLNM
jgi:hypothetical protein